MNTSAADTTRYTAKPTMQAHRTLFATMACYATLIKHLLNPPHFLPAERQAIRLSKSQQPYQLLAGTRCEPSFITDCECVRS